MTDKQTNNYKQLQGWVLEPLHGGPNPATKVVFVVQESMKGWVPGFAKKTLARRPLVIAKVAEYLERKTERMRSQQQQQQQVNKNGSVLLQSLSSGHSRRPSVMSSHLVTTPQQQQQQLQTLRHFNSTNRLIPPSNGSSVVGGGRPSPELAHHSILNKPTVPPPPPPLPTINKKHISFADHDITYTATPTSAAQQEEEEESTTTTDSNSSTPIKSIKTATALPSAKQHLYPSHRHPIQKVESIQLLKKLTFSTDNWKLTKELKDGTKHYMFNSNILSDDEEDEFMMQQQQGRMTNPNNPYTNNNSGETLKRKVPFIRADGVVDGGWTAEQLCSVIHCFGSRKICK